MPYSLLLIRLRVYLYPFTDSCSTTRTNARRNSPLLKAPSHSTSRSRGSISICSKPGLQLGLLWNKATSHHHSSAICNLHNLQLMLIRVSTTTGIRRSHSPSQCHPQHPQQTLSIDPHSMTTRCCRCSLQLLLHQGTLLYQMKTRKTQ